ncbi:MAG: SIS domain-containing protein [Eubacteriales bacterium]|nr:SIS domain-containing protein [Eubacteriales bacterium]
MQKVKQIVSEILAKQEINTVYYVGCGGSLSGFFPAKYFLSCEAKKLKVGYINANEFVHATPKEVGKDTVVILASQRGNTAETVKAAAVANEIGAVTIGLTFVVPSPLAETAQYVIQYEFGPESIVENQKASYGVKLALEILNQTEGYEKYDEMTAALGNLHGIVEQAKKDVVPTAIKYAWEFKDDSVIYTMGSGACWGPAHQEAICIFMEMQWINASVIHSGEFFHGPFEITDKNTAFLMMKSCGHTRALDDRALNFIRKFNDRIFVLDASEYGIGGLGDTAEYLEPLFYNNVIAVFNGLLADARKHPLTTRRYMWKFPY